MAFLIELGCKVRSEIEGIEGIVTSRSEHLNGCNRYAVQQPVDKEGKHVESFWYDEVELKVLKPSVFERKNQDRGGPPSKLK